MMWINVVLLLSVGAVNSEAKPDIEMNYDFYDKWCVVQCRSTDMPANSELLLSKMSSEDNSVYYFSDGHPQYFFYYDHDQGGTYVTVQIISNYLQWEGEYMCTVREKTPDPTTWTTEPEYIKYTTTPNIIGYKYDRNLNLDFLVNGTDVQYECIANGIPQPNITWTKEGDEQFLSVGPQLHFPSMTQAENGRYVCIAENRVGRAIGFIRSIEVWRYKPTMKYDSVPIRTVTENQINDWVDGKMQVLVHGCPPPIVTWWKESRNGRTKITNENNSYEHGFHIDHGTDDTCLTDTIQKHTEDSLRIHRFNKSDLGTYFVKAESSLGIVELKFIIRLDTD